MILNKKTTLILLSFIIIQDLCEDLFATGHIETIEYCMKVFHKFINRKLGDYFFEDYIVCQEIKETLEILKRELENFINYFDELVCIFFFFLIVTKKLFLFLLIQNFMKI